MTDNNLLWYQAISGGLGDLAQALRDKFARQREEEQRQNILNAAFPFTKEMGVAQDTPVQIPQSSMPTNGIPLPTPVMRIAGNGQFEMPLGRQYNPQGAEEAMVKYPSAPNIIQAIMALRKMGQPEVQRWYDATNNAVVNQNERTGKVTTFPTGLAETKTYTDNQMLQDMDSPDPKVREKATLMYNRKLQLLGAKSNIDADAYKKKMQARYNAMGSIPKASKTLLPNGNQALIFYTPLTQESKVIDLGIKQGVSLPKQTDATVKVLTDMNNALSDIENAKTIWEQNGKPNWTGGWASLFTGQGGGFLGDIKETIGLDMSEDEISFRNSVRQLGTLMFGEGGKQLTEMERKIVEPQLAKLSDPKSNFEQNLESLRNAINQVITLRQKSLTEGVQGSPTPQPSANPKKAQPKIGDRKTFPNGNVAEWDGTGWVKINK